MNLPFVDIQPTQNTEDLSSISTIWLPILRRKISLAAVLDQAARELLQKSTARNNEDQEQMRLQQTAAECFGAFEGGDARRSEKAREDVRERLRRRNGR